MQKGITGFKASNGFLYCMCKKNGIVSKKFQGERENCLDTDDYVATILHPLLKTWNEDDIYNTNETTLYYKQLPGSTPTLREDTPGGSKLNKASLTLLLNTNMSSSNKRKAIVIGKSAKPQSLKRKYGITPEQMQVDYYSSKKAWMNTVLFTQILTKWNSELQKKNWKVLLMCDQVSSHFIKEFSNIQIELLMVNTTSKLQPLDQGILRSMKMQYKASLACKLMLYLDEGYEKEAISKKLDIKIATDDIARVWWRMTPELIKNCFKKALFMSKDEPQAADPDEVTTEMERGMEDNEWRAVANRMDSSMTFDEFTALEDNEETSVEMTDEDILEMAKGNTNEENEVEDGPEEECDPQDAPIETSVDFLTALTKVCGFLAKKNVSSSSLDRIETELLQKRVAGSQTSLKSFFTPTKDSSPGSQEKTTSRPHGTPPSAKQSKSGGKAHLVKKSKLAMETEPQLGTSKQMCTEQEEEENILVDLTQDKTADATLGPSPALPCLPVDLMDSFDDTFDLRHHKKTLKFC